MQKVEIFFSGLCLIRTIDDQLSVLCQQAIVLQRGKF